MIVTNNSDFLNWVSFPNWRKFTALDSSRASEDATAICRKAYRAVIDQGYLISDAVPGYLYDFSANIVKHVAG